MPLCPGRPSASQLARQSLLMKKYEADESREITGECGDGVTVDVHHKDTAPYKVAVNHVNEESCVSESKQNRTEPEGGTTATLGVNLGKPTLKEACSTLKKFTAPGHLEHAQKKQAAQQYYLFRKLYSDLERAQARQKQLQLTHNQRVDKLKKRKEDDRRIMEDEANISTAYSFVSTEAEEDQRRAAEWARVMAIESRRQQVKRTQETDRYIEALKARLKEQLKSRKIDVPPLCACGLSLWDTCPETCANNCIFYKNPKGIQFIDVACRSQHTSFPPSAEYAKALSNLLVSLEL